MKWAIWSLVGVCLLGVGIHYFGVIRPQQRKMEVDRINAEMKFCIEAAKIAAKKHASVQMYRDRIEALPVDDYTKIQAQLAITHAVEKSDPVIPEIRK